jgi:SAM-dependent methyltransferase
MKTPRGNNQTKERTLCRVCGADSFKSACEKQGFRYVECAVCGVFRQYPYPGRKELQTFYRNYKSYKAKNGLLYLSGTYTETYFGEKIMRLADLGFPTRELIGKRLLDVGCATGQFLQFLKDKDLALLQGIDVSSEVVAIAKQQGLDCRLADFMEIDDQFDFITMWHVIEHVREPAAYFAHAFKQLKRHGSLLLETPVIGPISSAFGAKWRFFMPVEHLHLFPQDTLFNLARSVGFSVKSWVRFGSGNDSGTVPPVNKKAMDKLAKQLGIGDTIAIWFMK